jgi:mRNA-degrading endonuclease RelE of RelBE toxin-antitoxin system
VTSHTTERFRKAFKALPKHIQRQAREAYGRFKQDPYHPSLRFKQVHPVKPIYSVRISRDYRALGVLEGDEIIWFWIGSHAGYNRLLSQL